MSPLVEIQGTLVARSARKRRTSPLSRGVHQRRVFEPGSWLQEQPNRDPNVARFIPDGELDQYECSREAWNRAQEPPTTPTT